HARVGHCQASNQAKTPCQKRGVFAMCEIQKTIEIVFWRGFLCVKSHIKEKATLAGGLFCFMVLRRPEHDIRQVGERFN
ncbi:TPA: hypothetical protein ACTR19_000001, partial [Yersinia enterocolitica]